MTKVLTEVGGGAKETNSRWKVGCRRAAWTSMSPADCSQSERKLSPFFAFTPEDSPHRCPSHSQFPPHVYASTHTHTYTHSFVIFRRLGAECISCEQTNGLLIKLWAYCLIKNSCSVEAYVKYNLIDRDPSVLGYIQEHQPGWPAGMLPPKRTDSEPELRARLIFCFVVLFMRTQGTHFLINVLH